MSFPSLPTSASRLLAELVTALLGQGDFAPGSPKTARAMAELGEGLCRWLEHHPRILLIGGNPKAPIDCQMLGFTENPFTPFSDAGENKSEKQLHFAGFWRDRHLALICLRKGLTIAEFEHLFHLLTHYAGKGLQLRSRLFEEQTRGHLPHASMLFLDDLPDQRKDASWSARVALGCAHRDLNLLARAHSLSTTEKVDWREQLLGTVLDLAEQTESLTDFFANLDVIAEEIDGYDKDELVFSLLEHLDDQHADELCLKLCGILASLDSDKAEDAEHKHRATAVKWITRRLAEHMIEKQLASPEHFHALVLRKALLYEEIPQRMRPRVASLQVLTSFLDNPLKYFSEVENSHSPEVLETRLWRILEMVPKLVQALRFDVARQVLDFSRRFGPTFDLQCKPDIMQAMTDSATGVLMETSREQQAAFMKELPLMGRAGQCILMDLADHRNRSVRRMAIDALIKIGQPVVPFLFDTLKQKKGWHYLRNMLVILSQLNAGGPKVEKLFLQCCHHPEANVRKEALPGLARLMKERAADKVTEALHDPDLEVRKRAAACLGITGIPGPDIYDQLAEILGHKECSDDFAIQIVTAINRLKPGPSESPALESALHGLLGTISFLGLGGGRKKRSQALRIAAVQALGHVGSNRSVKVLKRCIDGEELKLAKAAEESMQILLRRSV